jgi:hypothetical protein
MGVTTRRFPTLLNVTGEFATDEEEDIPHSCAAIATITRLPID